MGAFSPSGHTLEVLLPRSLAPAARLHDPPVPPWLHGREVLAVTDPGPAGTNAAWRGALVARDRGAALHLLYVQAHAQQRRESEGTLHELARQLRSQLRIAVTLTTEAGRLQERIAHHACRAGLLVLPWTGERSWAAALFGALPERLYRALAMPMLVVRRPALASYRHVLVPVKLEPAAARLIAIGRDIARAPRMRVFHVLDTVHERALRHADIPERTLRLQRQRRTRHAYTVLNDLVAQSGWHEPAPAALVSFGPVPLRVLEIARAARAQLIVAGKTRRSLLSEALCGGVTQRLLRQAQADLLLLPAQGQS